MKRSEFLKTLAALPLIGFVCGAREGPEPVEAERWEDLNMPERWGFTWDDPNVGWDLANRKLPDGSYSVRCRTVDGVTEWPLLDGNGREIERWEGDSGVRFRTPGP